MSRLHQTAMAVGSLDWICPLSYRDMTYSWRVVSDVLTSFGVEFQFFADWGRFELQFLMCLHCRKVIGNIKLLASPVISSHSYHSSQRTICAGGDTGTKNAMKPEAEWYGFLFLRRLPRRQNTFRHFRTKRVFTLTIPQEDVLRLALQIL